MANRQVHSEPVSIALGILFYENYNGHKNYQEEI
jgi:hypothetical protein